MLTMGPCRRVRRRSSVWSGSEGRIVTPFVWVILSVTVAMAVASVVLQRRLRKLRPAAPAGPPSAAWEREGGTDLTAPASAEPAPAPATRVPAGSHVRAAAAETPVAQSIMADVLRGLNEIPPPPGALLQIVRELENVASSAKSVAEIVSNEPVLTATLLRVVNSAAFGLRREIVTPQEAVAFLGFSAVRSLFLRIKLGQLFKPPRSGGRCYNVEQLWAHSIVVSQTAEHIAKRSKRADPSVAATIGLLHDIGKVAINSQFPHLVHKLWEPPPVDPSCPGAIVPADESLLARERRLFGADHAFIGSFLAAKWELPAELVEAIRMHHVPRDQAAAMPEPLRRATYAVHIANQLAKYCQVYCDDMEIDILDPAVTTELGLPNDLDQLLDEATRKVIHRGSMLSPNRPKDKQAA